MVSLTKICCLIRFPGGPTWRGHLWQVQPGIAVLEMQTHLRSHLWWMLCRPPRTQQAIARSLDRVLSRLRRCKLESMTETHTMTESLRGYACTSVSRYVLWLLREGKVSGAIEAHLLHEALVEENGDTICGCSPHLLLELGYLNILLFTLFQPRPLSPPLFTLHGLRPLRRET
jgi:hypothetical protein